MSPFMEEAKRELERFEKCNRSRFLPTMQKTKCLGTYNDDVNPRENPVIAFGKVIEN